MNISRTSGEEWIFSPAWDGFQGTVSARGCKEWLLPQRRCERGGSRRPPLGTQKDQVSSWRDLCSSLNRPARGKEGAVAKMNRRAIAVVETMDRVSALDKKVLNNPKHAMNKVVQNGFHRLLLLLRKYEFQAKKLLQFTLLLMTKTIAVHLRARLNGRSQRPSWRRSASGAAWVIRHPGRRRSSGTPRCQ